MGKMRTMQVDSLVQSVRVVSEDLRMEFGITGCTGEDRRAEEG